MATLCFPAHAATCEAGYYLADGSCNACTYGYYCPGDDTVIQCPRDTNDWYSMWTSEGYDVISVIDSGYGSWGADGAPAPTITQCFSNVTTVTTIGTFYVQTRFLGSFYNPNNQNKLWYRAATGYYLSNYYWTSSRIWYHGVKACTNAPEHAHYTGAGTPDARDGSVTDANDCPWECDGGYYRSNEQCVACGNNRYCNNDTQYTCPPNNQDLAALSGGTVLNQTQIWTQSQPYSSDIGQCIGNTYIQVKTGSYLAECGWNGSNYYERCNGYFFWYEAAPGYYLSPYHHTSYRTWYYGVKACTNAKPEHSHYSGPGTPDAPDGSVKDANDCPWECDGGYYKNSNNTCSACDTGYYCTGGVRAACPDGTNTIGYGPGADEAADCGVALHIGDATVHLRSEKRTEHALHVRIGNQVFYGDMTTAIKGKIRAKIGDTVYSVYDDSM